MSDMILQTLGAPPHPPVASYTEPEPESSDTIESLGGLMRAVSAPPPQPTGSFLPPVPQTLAETGISETIVEELVLKTIYARGEAIGRDLAAAIGVKFS